jgi:hypothetical protein
MCGVLTWGLYAWLPPTWALLGGLLSVVRIAWFSYWMNSYWGGAAAAIGGALAFGALGRILKHQRARDAALLGIGVAILANSRPYEGFVLALTIFVILAVKCFRAKTRVRILAPILLPVSGVLIATFAVMAYYNVRVTGSPVQLPYALHEKTYAAPPAFVFQSLPPPVTYRHPMLRFFYQGWERNRFSEATSWTTFWHWHSTRYLKLWGFYLGPMVGGARPPRPPGGDRCCRDVDRAPAGSVDARSLCGARDSRFLRPSHAGVSAFSIFGVAHPGRCS